MSYLILFGGGGLTLLWWLLNFIVLIIYLFRENRKVSTMCIYAGLLPFILALPAIIFLAFGWAGMGFTEGPNPGVLEYIGAVAFTFILFFSGAILHLWFISIPCLSLIIYGIYRWRNDQLHKP